MKSLLPNNFKNTGAVDKPSSAASDLGNIGQGLGKKNSAPIGGGGFADFLMQAMEQDRQSPLPQNKHAALPQEQRKPVALSAPSIPPVGLQNVSDRQLADRVDHDLAQKRNAQPADRSPTMKDREDGKERVKVKPAIGDKDISTNTKPTKSGKSEFDASDRADSAKTGSVKAESAGATTGANAEAIKDLRPLKMAVGGKAASENMVGNNAVLAFMTGRLDRLDPESIPSIITGNPFLKQAAASAEISDLMLQPMSIADLCKMFEIDQSVINKATANGMDPTAIVSPKDFLAAVGADPARISSELQMMQQKLPLDGVQSYVDRARAMGQKLSQKIPGTNQDIVVEVAGPPDTAAAEALGNQVMPDSRAEDDRNALRNSSKVTPVGVPTVPQVATANVQSNMSKPAGSAAVSKPDLRGRPQMSSPGDLMESLIANRAMGLPSVGAANLTKEPLSLGNIVESDSDASLDPYANLGREMKPFQTETTMFAPVTVGKSMANLEEQLAANGFALNQNNMSKVSTEKSADVRDLLSDRRIDMSETESSFDLDAMKDAPLPLDQAAKNIVEGNTLAVEGLSKGSGGHSFQDSMSGGSDEKESGLGKEVAAPLGHVNSHANQNKAEGFGAVLESKAATPAPEQAASDTSSLHGKIMQHAAMMLKDGGGSMRMNVDAPGMGKIDLAINLSQNQLDVRILTPNDHVRDIINKELSGLRDGLGQQGISLRAVEVSNASQSSNQFAGGRFGQGHNGQQASYNEMKEYAQSFAGSFTSRGNAVERMNVNDIRSAVPSSWMNTTRDASRIAVRI